MMSFRERWVMKKTAQICVLSFLALIFSSLSTWAEDGKGLYMTKFCITCHGKKGISVDPNYPNLARQNELYLISQTKDIVEKRRANKLTLLMTENPVVTTVNAEEISAIAAHMTNITSN
jgi:cytochrome c553